MFLSLPLHNSQLCPDLQQPRQKDAILTPLFRRNFSPKFVEIYPPQRSPGSSRRVPGSTTGPGMVFATEFAPFFWVAFGVSERLLLLGSLACFFLTWQMPAGAVATRPTWQPDSLSHTRSLSLSHTPREKKATNVFFSLFFFNEPASRRRVASMRSSYPLESWNWRTSATNRSFSTLYDFGSLFKNLAIFIVFLLLLNSLLFTYCVCAAVLCFLILASLSVLRGTLFWPLTGFTSRISAHTEDEELGRMISTRSSWRISGRLLRTLRRCFCPTALTCIQLGVLFSAPPTTLALSKPLTRCTGDPNFYTCRELDVAFFGN